MGVRGQILGPVVVLLLTLGGCWLGAPAGGPKAPHVRFTDVTEQAGVRFIHERGLTGKKYMPETTGSGCAFLDYDGDGWLDLFLVNSGAWPAKVQRAKEAERRAAGTSTTHPALYRNNGDGTFLDVTRRAGLAVPMYGMGVCVGDFDNDGRPDLYVTCLGPNRLFRNLGNGRFQDAADQAGVRGVPFPPGGLVWKWSSACVWVDYDRDGWLDLAVGNYVRWSPHADNWCGRPGGPKGYCPPHSYVGLPCTIYRNRRNGTFTDVTRQMGVEDKIGKVWGLVACDFDGDHWPDLAVANDTVPNFLFLNSKGRAFTETAVEAGVAVGPGGSARAGMGIDAADWRNDGRFGLLVGNFSGEGLGLFAGDGAGNFTDVAGTAGAHESSLAFLTFGLFFFDYDNDGWQDAFCANGHIDDLIDYHDSTISYEQRPLLFHNERGLTFREVGLQSGAPLQGKYVLRGCAYGDYDNDGDQDILVMPNNDERARLWRNDGGNQNHWIRFKAEGTRSNRSGIGVEIAVKTDATTHRECVRGGSGYLSQNDLRVHFGLGRAETASEVEVRWPSGRVDRFQGVKGDREYLLREGQGLR